MPGRKETEARSPKDYENLPKPKKDKIITEKGDDIAKIAKKLNATPLDILGANPDLTTVKPGMVINAPKLPAGGLASNMPRAGGLPSNGPQGAINGALSPQTPTGPQSANLPRRPEAPPLPKSVTNFLPSLPPATPYPYFGARYVPPPTSYAGSTPTVAPPAPIVNMPRAEQTRPGLSEQAKIQTLAEIIATGNLPKNLSPKAIASLMANGIDVTSYYDTAGNVKGTAGTETGIYGPNKGFSNRNNIDANGNVIGTGGGLAIRNEKGMIVPVNKYRNDRAIKPSSSYYKFPSSPTYSQPLTPNQQYLLQSPGSFGLVGWRIND